MWKRISDRSASVQVHGERYCFPCCFEKELLRRLDEMQPAPLENESCIVSR
jgi:hypothetical protein